MRLTLKLSSGVTKELELDDVGIDVAEFKLLAETVVDIPAASQRVVYRGKVLKDKDVLSAVGVEDGHALHIVRGQSTAASSSGSSDPSKSASTAVAASSTPSGTTAQQASPSGTAQSAASAAPGAGPVAVNPYASLFQPAASNTGAGAPAPGGWAASGFGSSWAPSPAEAAAMMQNPMVMQMVEQMMRNPQLMQQLLASNPMLQGVPPEVLQQSLQMMNNPQMMQQMMQMMQSGAAPGAAAARGPPVNPFLGMGGNPFGAPAGNPRELYATQLEQLRAMGFPNEQANIAALQQSQGSVEFAIERLLGGG